MSCMLSARGRCQCWPQFLRHSLSATPGSDNGMAHCWQNQWYHPSFAIHSEIGEGNNMYTGIYIYIYIMCVCVCVCACVYMCVCVSIYYIVYYIYIYAIIHLLYTLTKPSSAFPDTWRLPFTWTKILRKGPRSNSSSSSLYKRRTDSAGEAALAPSVSKVSNGAGRASEGRDQVSGSASAIGHGATPRDGPDWGKMMKRWVANWPQP